MRPLYLEMTAFGSYASRTVLPFEEMKHGLYLVTGETGAGKTTIFDAIMFALFGVASGSDRKGDMLHSDYASKSVDTVVKLRFSQSGKEYTVERSIHFSKKRGTADQYGDGKSIAQLMEPDAAPVEGSEKVTRRCEQLLGLNADQFGRIIMLAQGEFKKFLKANSDEKNDILGKLFDNSVYVYYQKLLIGARDELSKRRSAKTHELRSLMEITFQCPPALSDEERILFLPDHPTLIDALRQLIEEEDATLERYRSQLDGVFQKMGEVNRKQGEAKSMNALIEELGNEQKRLSDLGSHDEEMKQRQVRLDRTDTALHTAMPVVEKAEQAEKAVKTNADEITTLNAQRGEAEQKVADAEAAVAGDDSIAREKQELLNRIQTIKDQLPRYAELQEKRKEKAKAEQNLAEAKQKRMAEEEGLGKLNEELAALTKRFESLEDAEAELAVCKEEAEKAAKRRKDMDDLCGELPPIRALETRLGEEKEKLLDLTKNAGEAASYADALYQKFIAAQAAVLANGLRQTLAKDAEATCPVCGTHLDREHLPHLAQLPDETPGKEDVDDARESAAEAERARGEQATAVKTMEATIAARKQATVSRASALLPEWDAWEKFSVQGILESAIGEARKNVDSSSQALAAAKGRKDERDRIKLALPQKKQEQQDASDRIDALRETERKEGTNLLAAEAAIGVLLSQLGDEDEERVKTDKQRMESRVSDIEKQIQDHKDLLDEANTKCAKILGSLAEKERASETLAVAQEEAQRELDRVLKETAFVSPDDVRASLSHIQGMDGERWIKEERATLSDHASDKKKSHELIKTLQQQTAGKLMVDLKTLEALQQQLSEQYAAANDAYTKQDSLLKNHRSVLERASDIRKELAASDRAWERLDKLASLAEGASSESGKLSFDRYVMGTMFREILEMANRRMELMSGGRYELVHKIAADRRNAKAGLEIAVLDNTTGLQRDSDSLSGGESFFTSLALALGLSDVVQNHAGGKQMDALFIDEGFGSLSDDVLDRALTVLNQLTEGNRLVGIISHVDKLDESIPQKIRVRHDEKGSSLKLELA